MNENAKKNTIDDCALINLPRIHHKSGNITPVRGNIELPFPVNRIFYLYDIPGGESRGAHAHKVCHQFLVAASGSFDILVNDGQHKKVFTLNRPYIGLHIPPYIWAEEFNFSSGGICLVLASHKYDAEDYIRDYNRFLSEK
ncbi:WxcM-like, C-terminal [Hydrobacter penzbergensis]|uniref:WxcM-like, C-terminal n=1 Tax=Hydrobacter penzbergensis TaxID=1235997 RepID=A0A8X8LDI9_9BACT|nr:FdtA/QdtA family cupin domain-containing protein [Hydrobacter penzbergensis]SDW85744.1 WxcM-like, C-terminal [Hydrobacter penzbergensis]